MNETDDGPFIAWPGWENLRLTLPLGAVLALLGGGCAFVPVLVYGLHTWHPTLRLEMWRLFPHAPQALGVYYSWIALLLLAPFVLRTWRELVPLAATLFLQTLIAAAVFILYPLENLSPVVAGFNQFPALPVALALTCAQIYGARSGRLGWFLLVGWAVCVAVAGLFVHYYSVVDILGGIVLGSVGLTVIYPRAKTDAFLDTVRVEVLCLREFWFYSRRHLRYLLIFVIMYRYCLAHWRESRVIRVGFCFLQHVDDILDGDRPCAREPDDVAAELTRMVDTGEYDESIPAVLARRAMREAEGLPEAEAARAGLRELLDIMRVDRQRVLAGRVLTRAELLEQHRRTFYYSVDVMLLLTRCAIRADETDELLTAFGWCSTMRDLEEDLDKGLVNVPQEVVDAARAEGAADNSYAALLATPSVRAWIRDYQAEGLAALERFDERLDGMQGRRGVRLLALFSRSMTKFGAKFAARHPEVFGGQ